MREHLHAHVEALRVLLVVDVVQQVGFDLGRVDVPTDASDHLERDVVVVLRVVAFEHGTKCSFAELSYNTVFI